MVLSPALSSAVAGHRTALWCVPVADLGGVARHVLDAVRNGVPGWRIVVLCPDGALAEKLRDLDAPVVAGLVSPADGAATAIRTIRRVLKHLRPDVLHTHLAFADLAGIAAVTGLRSGAGRRIRVVSTEHGISGVRGFYQASTVQAGAKSAAHRARLLRSDRVIAVSNSTAEQVAAQWGSGRKVSVIRNGVDTRDPAPRPQPGLRVLSLARLAPEKRIDQLLRAFGLVAAEHPDARLTIAGGGPEELSLKQLAASHGLSDLVSFPGHVDPAEALRTHDVIVQLSVWENLSYTVLDAVVHGLGVVATDVGGNREIVPENCLVDAEHPAAVAQAIVNQGNAPEARPATVSRFGVAEMCTSIGEVYRKVAA